MTASTPSKSLGGRDEGLAKRSRATGAAKQKPAKKSQLDQLQENRSADITRVREKSSMVHAEKMAGIASKRAKRESEAAFKESEAKRQSELEMMRMQIQLETLRAQGPGPHDARQLNGNRDHKARSWGPPSPISSSTSWSHGDDAIHSWNSGRLSGASGSEPDIRNSNAATPDFDIGTGFQDNSAYNTLLLNAEPGSLLTEHESFGMGMEF